MGINEKTNLLFWYQFKSKVFKSRQTKNLTHKYMKLTLRDSAGNTFDVQNLFRFMKKLKIHPITKQGLYESFVFQKSEVRSELIFLEKLFAGRIQLFDYQKVENFYFQGRCLNYVKPHYHPDKFNRYLNRLSVYFLSLHQLFYKEMKIKEKLLNKFRNSFSKIRILKQLKLNQNKLKQFKLCSNKIKITKIKLQNKFKKLFKKKVQIRKLNQNFEKITKITDKLNQKLKISQLLNEKILQLNQQNQILRNISIFSKKFEKKKFPFAKIKFKNLKANKFEKKKKSLFSRLKFSGKNKLKFFFPRNFFDSSFLHRRDIIYWL